MFLTTITRGLQTFVRKNLQTDYYLNITCIREV